MESNTKNDIFQYQNLLDIPFCLHESVCLRVQFLLKTDFGYPEDVDVITPWQPREIFFAIAPSVSSTSLWHRLFQGTYLFLESLPVRTSAHAAQV